MGLSLKTSHWRQYKDIAKLLVKYGRSDLMKQAGLEEAFGESDAELTRTAEADSLAADLEKLGPTYIKLGQLLSTRPELFPLSYVEALSRLQDQVEPFPFEEVQAIISAELGIRLSKAFEEFEPIPIAAASLGQVHRAMMRDGRMVAVKVQRPGIKKQIMHDLDAFDDLAEFLDKNTELGASYQFTELVRELRKSLLRELDYRQEAHNLNILHQNLREFDSILVPTPIDDYSTSCVLTMEYIRGKKITALSPLAKLELNGEKLARELFAAYLKQILVDGFFHADPHPGNVFITEDQKIALLDLGMVGHLTPHLQENLLQLVLAITEGHAEEATEFTVKLGQKRPNFDEVTLARSVKDLVSKHQHLRLEQIQTGHIMLEIAHVSGKCGLLLPPELMMLGKALLNLDTIGRTLDQKFDPNHEIRKNTAEVLRQRMLKSISPSNFFSVAVEMKDFLVHLPGRINQLLDAAANNALKVKVEAIDELRLIEGLQKIANRITVGLILASLILGAAMLMRVETSFRILGYPGLAMILFLAAVIGGVLLVLNSLWHDHETKKKLKR